MGRADDLEGTTSSFICGDQEEVHVAKSRGCGSLPRLFLVVTMFLRKLGSPVS